MSGKVGQAFAKKFRDKFAISRKEVANWFPGHMAKGIKQMQNKLRSIDCIIEVHDARIPISGRNHKFYHLLTAAKPRLLVLNKADTVTTSRRGHLTASLRNMGDKNIIYTNCKNPRDHGVAQIVPTMLELINSSERYNREQSLNEFAIMIIGIPNVGKSSLINVLRNRHLHKGKATRVGAIPGVTRSVLERIRISEEPSVFLLDTPGIMQPNITDAEMALKLALCAVVEAHMIGITRVADYLLFWLNKMHNFSYVEQCELKEPTDDINELLLHLAIKYEKYQTIRTPEGSRVKHPSFDAAGQIFVRHFRDGDFGKIMLDDDLFDPDSGYVVKQRINEFP